MNREQPDATPSINPFNGELLGYAPLHTIPDVHNAMKTARRVQAEWAAVPVRQRAAQLIHINAFLIREMDRIVDTIARDNGKSRLDALATEVMACAIATRYYCRKAPAFLTETSTGTGSIALFFKRTRVVRVPYGVIGIISPWNYPFSIPFNEIIMGLLAGNAVLLKTATETQAVGQILRECILSSGIPNGLFHYLNIPGRVAGPAFLEAGVDKLFFTGSVPVGKQLMAEAAKTLTPVNLELGGNDAMLVCPDADPDRAAAGAVWAGLSNAGQSCGGVERIYVHQDLYERFMDRLKNRVESLRMGSGMGMDTDIGVMTTASQCKTVQAHIDDALEKGAEIFARTPVPEKPVSERLIAPVVLTRVNHEMRVMREETFGPVLAVMKVTDMEEALRLANDSELGLTGSVWSRNRKQARRLARRVQAGAVTINDHLMSHGLPETAWGGFKQSGIGRSHGKLGFMEMVQPQMIVDDILPRVKRSLWWHPYSRKLYNGLKGLTTALYGRGLKSRLSGWLACLRVLPRMFRRNG